MDIEYLHNKSQDESLDATPTDEAATDEAATREIARNTTLLQRFEPVIRFTRGEQFFPMDVAPYVEACSLWAQKPRQAPVCLVPHQQMTLARLGQFNEIFATENHTGASHSDAVYFLRFTEPLSALELTTELVRQHQADRDDDNVFRAGRGRLARVGYFSRFIDALFSLSLLTRGRVPGDAAAVSANHYRTLRETQEEYRYHGRVVRQGGRLVLQYWFFYFYNNWRTRFFGANDHEADWEMICVYLSASAVDKIIDAGEDLATAPLEPGWVAYASHDFHGDDLRRRWDDPEIEKVGEHPVIYAGAGSHASYFSPGEYITELALPFLLPLVQLSTRLQAFWHDRLRQYTGDELQVEQPPVTNIFHIPFVDYATWRWPGAGGQARRTSGVHHVS